MNPEPRRSEDYGDRQVKAARRVLVDLGQVLAGFRDCVVVIGGWVPDLLAPDADEPHIGSIDVDLAIDAEKLSDGRYAELLKLLLDTGRYRRGDKEFQLVVEVALDDGQKPVQVEVEFLAPKAVELAKNVPKLLAGFRVLQVAATNGVFSHPVEISLSGRNVRGATNTVRLRTASAADALMMKAHAIDGRDKPKDVYDLCYCLERLPGGIEQRAAEWKARGKEQNFVKAEAILREKFNAVDAFGPRQLVEFHASPDPDTRAIQARHAFELVDQFLRLAAAK